MSFSILIFQSNEPMATNRDRLEYSTDLIPKAYSQGWYLSTTPLYGQTAKNLQLIGFYHATICESLQSHFISTTSNDYKGMQFTNFQSPLKYMLRVSLQSWRQSSAISLPLDEKMQPFEVLSLGERMQLIDLSERLQIEHLQRSQENIRSWIESGAHSIPDMPLWVSYILATALPLMLQTRASAFSLKYSAMSSELGEMMRSVG